MADKYSLPPNVTTGGNKDSFNDPNMALGEKLIPDVLYIGRERAKWPITTFQHEGHAKSWLADGERSAAAEGRSGNKRRLFRVDMTKVDVVEMEIVPAIESRLQEKES